MQLCLICCENKKTNQLLCCSNCDLKSCFECVNNYLSFNLNTFFPKCMNKECLYEWSFNDIQKLPRKIKDNLKKIQKQILFQNELKEFPRYLYKIEVNKKILEIKEKINLNEKYFNLLIKSNHNQLTLFDKYVIPKFYYKDTNDIDTILCLIQSELKLLKSKLKDYNENSKISYLLKCNYLNCEGYIFKENEKCNLCNKITCTDCGNAYDDLNNHLCDIKEQKTFEYIKKYTKKCPCCQSNILKTDGCSQMFCTCCNNVFIWETLEICDKYSGIHNPHYFEKLNDSQNDENLDNLLCNEFSFFSDEFLTQFIDKYIEKYDINKYNYIFNSLLKINNHLKYQYTQNTVKSNIDIIQRYLTHKLSIEHFKNGLYKNYILNILNEKYLKIINYSKKISKELILNLFYKEEFFITTDDFNNVISKIFFLENYANKDIKLLNENNNTNFHTISIFFNTSIFS